MAAYRGIILDRQCRKMCVGDQISAEFRLIEKIFQDRKMRRTRIEDPRSS